MTEDDRITRFVHRVVVPLEFEAGLAPGAGKASGNVLTLTRSAGSVILRGTAIAGVLRHAYARTLMHCTESERKQEVERWFGRALENQGSRHHDRPSPLRVSDARLDIGARKSHVRMHNEVDRHSGAVREQNLFCVEALPPGTSATLVLYLHVADESGVSAFLDTLVGELRAGLVFGGHGARGIGLAKVSEAIFWRRFDLERLDDCAAWLDESWTWRSGYKPPAFDKRKDKKLKHQGSRGTLEVVFKLGIPRGQDLCVADGMGLDHAIEPQRVLTVRGQEHWRLPGASLRGVFRAWVMRLAARAAMTNGSRPPTDTMARYQARGPAKGDDAGWGFVSNNERDRIKTALKADPDRIDEHVPCPVLCLFGSLYGAGRIHIADSLSTQPIGDDDAQTRRHVAVDRITGGANEGFLFDHRALLPGPVFQVKMTVQRPSELEAQWLARTLLALDMGLLRVGSSKSSGRLSLLAPPDARGPYSEFFRCIQPLEART